jgi:hypothetical protein
MEFFKGQKVRVWDDPEDIAVVKGISKQFIDNQGQPLIELEDGDSITAQALSVVQSSEEESP